MENSKITAFVRRFTTKEGKPFFKMAIKGKYLPQAVKHKNPLKEDEYYRIACVGGVTPSEEGKFSAIFSEGWIDERPDTNGLIVRLRLVENWKKEEVKTSTLAESNKGE